MAKTAAPSRYGYTFPAIRGIQAGREYYVSMCPLRLLPKIFTFDEEELAPELRAQRVLNKARLPQMARYILDNPKGYVFSAITASIDGPVKFTADSPDGDYRIGILSVDMNARFLINDGQHRRAAIEAALREMPEMGDETIAVVFFLDAGLGRSQQMFADLNRYAIRPSKSLGVLYDQRDDKAGIVKTQVLRSAVFRGLVELEKSTLAPRSSKLFTLSSLYAATNDLLGHAAALTAEEQGQLAIAYWDAVSQNIREWNLVRERKMASGEVRRDFIHSHGIVLHALGRAGNCLLAQRPKDWPKSLARLQKLDWSRENSALWEGRAMIAGHVSKARQNLVLTTNVIKKTLGLQLGPEELRVEEAFERGAA